MTDRKNQNSRLGVALEATGNLWEQGFNALRISGDIAALAAHGEIEHAAINGKQSIFYRYLVPLRMESVTLLAEMYRRCFKLALAHPREAGHNPHEWVCEQLQTAVGVTLEWIRDWYILACDGENQQVRRAGSIECSPGQTVSLSVPISPSSFPPPQSWRAPSWLFSISLVVGVGPLKTMHVPANDSDQKLGAAHTRLLFKGARRSFLLQLGTAIETVRNEELAAADAIPAAAANAQTRRPNNRAGRDQKLKLYAAIQKVLTESPATEGIEFCFALDKRHAPPLLDWVKSGCWREGLTWREAWSNLVLRDRIRRVRQEAMKNL